MTMKQIFVLLGLFFVCLACSEERIEPSLGGIAGSVSDKTTGESVATVNVSLSPGGASTVTGSDGTFAFRELDAGTYTVAIRKEGYLANDGTFSVTQGKQTSAHLLIERIPAVVTTDLKELDFGNDASVNTLSFKIVNSGYEDLAWEIEQNCPWIQEVKPKSGTLGYGKTGTIVVVIDRNLLDAGENKTVLVVKSTNGSSQVEVKAVGEERVLPVLNTLEVTDFMRSSATLNGEILNAGIPAYTERGFVYNTEPMPTLENALKQLTAPVTDSAVYSCRIEGLTMGTTYYVRAYAKNSNGVSYASNEVSFVAKNMSLQVSVQEATGVSVSAGTAVLHGTIVSVGTPAYTERGFVYNTISNPTVEDTKVLVAGNGTGAFSAAISGLSLNQVYYVRAYAINKSGVVYSSSEISFTTQTTLPQVSVQNATNIKVSDGTAVLHGAVVSVGDPAYTERGFVYSTISNPTVEDTKVLVAGSGTGAFSAAISELSHDQTYYVRAYAINKAGVVYSSSEISFTMKTTLPQVSIQEATEVNLYTGTAVLHGKILNVGVPAYTERGFVYNTISNPTVENTKVLVAGNGTGAFSAAISKLSYGQTYYVRAYAINKAGVSYSSSEIQVSMKPTLPLLQTLEATNINLNARTATLNGTIIKNGLPAYTEKGFVYGTIKNPTLDNSTIFKVVVQGNEVGEFSAKISQLRGNEDIYFRAYVINQAGTVYGESMKIPMQYMAIKAGNLAVQRGDLEEMTWTSAMSMCENSTVAGYSDWRLPTEDELMMLYANREIIGGFSESIYWSSDYHRIMERFYIHVLNFEDGQLYQTTNETDLNSELLNARCVRTLK